MSTTNGTPQVKTEVKSIKHIFEPDERNQMGGDLARAIAGLRGVESEFDQVKAGFKARVTAAEAQIDNLSTALMNGFEMRNSKCVVVYRPRDRKKDYYLESDLAPGVNDAQVRLTEDMTPGDFQAELIQAESAFSNRAEIEILPCAGNDGGVLVVGKLNDKWFSALRVSIGQQRIEDRLDSEQPCFKKRADAINRTAKRLKDWIVEKFGKDLAKGFDAHIDASVEEHKERVE